MAGFNEMISRTGAEALIPVEESKQIIQGITEESAVMKLAKRLPNMSSKTLKMPVLSSLPYAYFVDGDTGMKQTTKVDWGNKVITAEEIAVIVPVADAILADAEYDIRGLDRYCKEHNIDNSNGAPKELAEKFIIGYR